MKTYSCVCGNTLFFENTCCLSCQRELGWCPSCARISALVPESDGIFRCANEECGARLSKCYNYAMEFVCNRCVVAAGAVADHNAFCDCCVYNDTIPDLSIEGNREKWARLEAAKRRLFYTLDLLGLPHGTAASGFEPPLAFDFKADSIPANEFWHPMGGEERVYTGHADGKITINVREADSVERESLRVELDEAHRTLVGHFHHEIGHYYWTILVQGVCDGAAARMFGDPDDPGYAEALERHYRDGPPPDWPQRYISAYSSMHPWEDFAETFSAYLDLVSVLDTAAHVGFHPVADVLSSDFDQMIDVYRRIGVALNEMNRTMGLLDFLPEIFIAPAVEKMRFVHELVRNFRRGDGW